MHQSVDAGEIEVRSVAVRESKKKLRKAEEMMTKNENNLRDLDELLRYLY